MSDEIGTQAGPETSLRGEIEIELEGQSFTLRPSYEAIVAIEKQTGQKLVPLAAAADVHAVDQTALAIIVTECIKAWGAQTGDVAARGVNAKRIGELLYTEGTMFIMPRIAVLLATAASGGVTASGEMKATTTTIPEIPDVA